MADSKEFGGITREKLDGIRKALAKRGVTVPAGDDVEVEGPFGVKLRAVFNEAKEILRLQITDKPIFVTENQIWKVVEQGASGMLGK